MADHTPGNRLTSPTVQGGSTSIKLDDGPPPPDKKPKKASLYSQAGKSLMSQGTQGLGPEGGSPQIMAQKFLQGIVSNTQALSSILPGIIPVTGDLLGRLQTIVPQLLNDINAGGNGFVPAAGMPPQQPNVGAPPIPVPPMGGGPTTPPGPGPVMPPMGQ